MQLGDREYEIMDRYLGEGWSDGKAFARDTMQALRGFEDWRQSILRYTNGKDKKAHDQLLIKFRELDKVVSEIEQIAKKSKKVIDNK